MYNVVINQLGGGKKPNMTLLVVILLALIVVKTLVVQTIYNKLGPKLASNFGANVNNFSELTLLESFALIILTTSLFC